MTQEKILTEPQKSKISYVIPMLIGAGFALIMISLFLFYAGEGRPEWGKYWMIRPLIIVPAAGAMGGLFYYFMKLLSSRGRLNKTVAVILSFIVYVIGFWMGFVLGLDGTYWN